jgi:hypothetical protein
VTAPVRWAETPAARLLDRLDYAEPQFRSREQVIADWEAARGTAPTDQEVRQSMLADRARFGSRVVNLPGDKLSQALGTERVSAGSQVVVLDDAQVEQLERAHAAAIAAGAGTIRPGEHPGRPYWSSRKGSGLPWRTVVFGPPGGERAAAEVLGQWQAEDLAEQVAEKAELRRMGIFF